MTITVNGENDFTFGDPIPVGAFGGSLAMKGLRYRPGCWNYRFHFKLESVLSICIQSSFGASSILTFNDNRNEKQKYI